MRTGKFRDDLYYRLNVVPLHVPGLRERTADIPLLAQEFISKFGNNEDISLDPKLVDAFMQYSWPGNVRELENLIARMVILRRGNKLTVKDLPEDFGRFNPREEIGGDGAATRVTLEEAEKNLIIEALEKTGWNKSKAAKRLDIPRHVLIYRLTKFGISTPEDPAGTA